MRDLDDSKPIRWPQKGVLMVAILAYYIMTDEELEELRKQKLAEMEQQLETPETPGAPVSVDGSGDLQELVDTHEVVFVDFYADWCGPCKQQDPILESFAAESEAVIAKVDVDRNQQLAQSHGVRSIPTMVVYVDGEPAQQLVGVQQRSTLEQLLERYAA